LGAIVVILVGCGCGAVAAVAAGLMVYLATGSSYEQLRAQGEQYITQIESYHEKRGVYATYLEAAGIHPQRTRYGNWQYRLDENKERYRLQIGQYDSWDPFALWWDSESRTWYLDT
jgi:hypothetical protein